MRVLFINPGGHANGGAERSLAELTSGLVERGHDVHVALMAEGDLSTVLRDRGATIAGVVAEELQVAPRHASIGRFVTGAAAAAPRIAGIVKGLRQVIAATEPDVIHSNGFRSHILSPFLAPGSPPIVWSLRDRAPRQLHRSLLKATSTSAAAVVANSAFTASQMDHRSMHVVANPVSPIETVDRDLAREALGIDTDRHVVSVLAHLHPSKGHDVMVDALARWGENDRPVLAIAGGQIYPGSAEYETELRRLAERLRVADDIRWLGSVEDVTDLYSASDVIVHPCRHPEGFGRVVIEAQSARVPIVATDLGGVASLIRHDDTGMLVPSDDAYALHVAIDDVMWPGPRRTRLIERGHAASTNFDRASHTFEVENVYRTVLGMSPLTKPVARPVTATSNRDEVVANEATSPQADEATSAPVSDAAGR